MMEMVTFSPTSSSLMNHNNVTFDQFCVGMQEGSVVLAVVGIPCSLVGVIVSIWVIRLLLLQCQLSKFNLSNDVYMIGLTIMDLMFNVSVLPGLLCLFLWRNTVHIKICDFFFSLSMSGRPLFMVCICVDCFMAVLCPITYRNLTRSRYRQVLCVPVCGFTLVYGLIFGLYPELFATLYTIIPYVLSLPPITFCNLSILHALRKPDPSGKADVHPQKQRALQTITNSFIMAVVSYLPPIVVYGLTHILPLTQQQIFCQVSTPALIGTTLGSTIQPLLYLSNQGHLRNLWDRCGGGGPPRPK